MALEALLGYGRFLLCLCLRSNAGFPIHGISLTANVSTSLHSGPFLMF